MPIVQLLPDVPGASTYQAATRTRFFFATAAITAGDFVAIDPTVTTYGVLNSIVTADADGGGDVKIPFGVAKNAAAAAGDLVEVYVSGYVPSANIANAVNAVGIALVISTTAGRAGAWSAAGAAIGTQPIGCSLAAASGNTAPCLLFGNRGILGLSAAGG